MGPDHNENKTPISLSEEKGRDIEIYLNAVFNYMEGPIFVKDGECRLLLVNDAFCAIFGLTRNDIIGKTLAEKVPPSERAHFLSVDRQVLKEGQDIVCEEALTADGLQTRTILTRKSRFIDPSGDYFIIGIINDITESKQTEERLKLAASVFSHAREGIMITDAMGAIVEVNDTFSLITGYSRDEVLGQNPRLLHSGRQLPDFYVSMWESLLADGHWKGEIWNRRKSGEVYAELLTISEVRNTQGLVQNYVGLFSDITQQKGRQQQLEHIAHHDVLTNLANRVLLADRLSQAMLQCQRRHQSLAVAYLDLDGFKTVNDTYGHNVGDELLIAVSQHMKEALREGDTLARVGGDEFIALLVDLETKEDSEPVLERLLKATADPLTLGDVKVQVSASIGVTLYPQDGTDAEQLIRHADQAMYLAKQSGKNRYQLFDMAQNSAGKRQRSP